MEAIEAALRTSVWTGKRMSVERAEREAAMPRMQCLAVETRRSSESAGLWSGDLPTRRNTRAVPHRAVAGNLSRIASAPSLA